MKKSVKKFNFSNKLAYTLVAIFSLILIGVGVYAYGTSNPSVMGHSLGEITFPSCSSTGQALTWNGNSWVCTNPNGTDTRFTVNANGVCYTAPATCSLTTEYCNKYLYITEYFGSTCDSVSPNDLDTFCNAKCYNNYGLACDGTLPSECSGGTSVYYVGKGWCEGGSSVYCSCDGYGQYMREIYTPSGQRCI